MDQFQNDVKTAANMYVNQDKNAVEIKRFFLAKGYEEAYTDKVIDVALKASENVESKSNSSGILIGVLLILGGIGLSILMPGTIFYGAIVVGVIYLFKGIFAS